MPVPKPLPFAGASVQNLAHVQPQTRAGQKSKGIGMIAAQAGNFVQQFMQKKQQEKTQALAQDVSRSLELQKGIDQAQQVLAQDPNNTQAKMTLQKNQALLGSLLNGKNGKEIAKAYDITFGDGARKDHEDKVKDPAHQAMQQAMKQQQEEQRLKEFEGQMPKQMGDNPAYAQRQAELNQEKKNLETMQKVYAPIINQQMKDQNANARTEANIKSREATTQAQINAKAKEDALNRRNKLDVVWAERSARLAEIEATKKAGGVNKSDELNLNFLGKRIEDVTKQITDLKAKKAALGPTDDHKYESKGIQEQIDSLNNQLYGDDELGADHKQGALEKYDEQLNRMRSNPTLDAARALAGGIAKVQ
jgi:hypothetical protein